jgi:PAS domain S-box-containing protein
MALLNHSRELGPRRTPSAPNPDRAPEWRRVRAASQFLAYLLLWAGLACLLTAPARAAIPPENSGLITSIGRYRQILQNPARADYLISLEAVVTYADPLWKLLWVQDDSGAIQVNASSQRLGLEAGQRVLIEGVLKSGDAAGLATRLPDITIGVLGPARMPAPLPLPKGGLFQLAHNAHWVEARGVVRAVSPFGRLRLAVLIDGQSVPVLVRYYEPANLNGLVDARVQIAGICDQEIDAQGAVVSARLYTDSFQSIKVETPGITDPFALELTPLNQVAAAAETADPGKRKRVRGRVTGQTPGEFLVLSDPAGNSIQVRVPLRNAFDQRELVDAIGFPERVDGAWVLADAMVRVTPSDRVVAAGQSDSRPSEHPKANPNLPVQRTVKAVLDLPGEQARLNYPVRAQGVVTYSDPYEKSLFIQDGERGVYVNLGTLTPELKPGQIIEVTGVTEAGGVLTMIAAAKLDVLGEGLIPAAAPTAYHQAMSGEFDSRRVKIRGVIQSGDPQIDRLIFDLVAIDGRAQCSVLLPPNTSSNYLAKVIDSVVEVEGVCLIDINRASQPSGMRLVVPSDKDISILERAPTDVFDIPTYPIKDALGFLPKNLAGRRVKVKGVVTLWRRGKEMCLQDASGGVRAFTDKNSNLELGDEVELVGFRTYGEYAPVLRNVDFRIVRKGLPQPAPKAMQSASLVEDTNNYDHLLVTLEAELLKDAPASQAPELILQQGNITFTASMEQMGNRRFFPELRAGSRLRVTGVCYPRLTESLSLMGFRLCLRQPEDIQVLRGASWMTGPRVALLAFFLIATLAGVGSWAALLRRQVARQMRTIRQRFEREALLEARCTHLIERANDIIVACDAQGRITSLNQAGENALGYPRAEALQLDFYQLVAERDRPRLREIFEGRQSPPLTGTYELEVFTKQGRQRTWEMSTQFLNGDGRLSGIESIARDITGRKQAEERLRLSEAQLAEAQRIGHVGSWEYRVADRQFRMSAEARRLLGMEENSETCRPGRVLARLHPHGLKAARLALRRLLQGEKDVGVDQRVRLGSGLERVVHGRMEAQFDEAGRCVRLRGTILDITERDHAQEQLRMLSQAVEQSPAIVMITDTRGAIEYVNQKFVEVTGYSCAEATGRNPRFLKSGLTPLEVYQDMWKNILLGRPWSGELRNQKKNGETYWEQMVITPIKDRQGQTIRLLALKEDITERKRAETLKVQLETQLRQAQKMEALGTLAGGIAHDFNNILGAIAGYNELARLDAQAQPEILESLDQIAKASARAKDLVQQILAFSRQSKQERKPIRLQTIVQECLKLLRSTLPANIEIVPNFQGEPLVVMADPIQIHQVVMNLCANAAHAMRGQPGRLTVGLQAFEADVSFTRLHPDLSVGPYARLLVGDTGHGMDAATLKRIFDPFFTTKAPGEGTGLGLAVVHGIVEDHHGAIVVESAPRAGTTFQIFFPSYAAKETSALPAPPAAPRGRGEHILFVDDEPALCLVAQKLLQNWGYRVTTQCQATDALTRFRAQPYGFDLVITDLSMPGMSGVDFAAELIKIRPELPVLLASGFVSSLTSESAAARGIREIMLKPVSPAELSRTVDRILHSQPAPTPTRVEG